MSNKTFKQRVIEEADSFAEIYESFREDLLDGWQPENGPMPPGWDHLFAVPLHGAEADEPPDLKAARLEWKVPHKHDAVREAVRELGDLIRVGPIVMHDQRVSVALEMGLLTPNHVGLPSEKHPDRVDGLAHRLRPEHDDPVFWRALLEVLCRAFVAKPGQAPWSLNDMIDLALDMDEIRRGNPNKDWKAEDFYEELQNEKKYALKYPNTDSAAGAASVGLERVKRIIRIIKMDDKTLQRLEELYPRNFQKRVDERIHRGALGKTQDYVGEMLGMAGDLKDAFEDARTPESAKSRGA